jgi:NAD(P)-dependent dehydrogenase (short-subunit alcohol dehydrogenase family)
VISVGALDGKVAIVTGAGRGVGRGEALALASEGAKVVVNDLGGEWDGTGQDTRPAQQVADEITSAGGEGVANYDNVASWEGSQKMVNQAIDSFGDLDILVNNAGILRDRTLFNMSEEEWDAVINVHLKGHFCPSHFATAYWRQRSKEGTTKHRTIVNTTSESGLFGNAGQTNYAAAKMGIVSLTIATAKECSRYGVTANAVAPRARTRLTVGTFGDFGKAEEGKFDVMDPDNVAPFVAWLCSDDAADVTGQAFIVWGASVAHIRLPHVSEVVSQDRRWTLEELSARKAELFKEVAQGTFEVPPSM